MPSGWTKSITNLPLLSPRNSPSLTVVLTLPHPTPKGPVYGPIYYKPNALAPEFRKLLFPGRSASKSTTIAEPEPEITLVEGDVEGKNHGWAESNIGCLYPPPPRF